MTYDETILYHKNNILENENTSLKRRNERLKTELEKSNELLDHMIKLYKSLKKRMQEVDSHNIWMENQLKEREKQRERQKMKTPYYYCSAQNGYYVVSPSGSQFISGLSYDQAKRCTEVLNMENQLNNKLK